MTLPTAVIVRNTLGVLVFICAGPMAQAQDTAQDTSASTSVTIEEVVVTARKREESLQEVPVAVTAFTSEMLEERQLQDVNDLARFAPGLVFDKAFGRATERPVIRGQGNVLAGVQFGVEAGAAYFVDGIYYPGDIQSLDFNEVERVEVIRGPQSALYGRNTYSGAINFITRSPSSEFGGGIRAKGDGDEQDYSLRVEGPLFGETLTASLGARYYTFDGQWKNELTGEDVGQEETTSVSGVLEWRPGEDHRLRVRASYNEDRDGTRPFVFQDSSFNNCYPGTRSLAYYATSGSTNNNQYFCGEIQPGRVLLNTTQPVTNPQVAPGVPANVLNPISAPPLADQPPGTTRAYDTRPGIAFSGVDRDLTLVSALYEWDISGSGYTLTVDGAIRDEERKSGSDSDFMPLNFFSNGSPVTTGFEAAGANTSKDEYQDYSVEVKFASPVDRSFRWMAGAFYYEQDQKNFDINFFNPDGRSLPDSITDVFNKSVFALAEWEFAPTWTITAEGRYMEETKGAFEYCITPSAMAPFCGATVNNPGPEARFSGQDDWTKFTPRVTLKWQATSDLNLYAVYAEGVKPGGFNGSAGLLSNPPLTEYDQETSKNYELGLKSTWLDGRVLLNVAGYFIDAEDVQLTTPVVRTDGSAVTSVASNQGAGEVLGVEIESTWRVIDPLTLSLTYALADTEFTEGCDDFQWTLTSGGGNNALRPGAYNPAAPASGGTNLNGQGDCSIEGAPFPLSAKHTGSFAADWRQPIGDKYEFFLNADVSYTDKRPVQVHNNPFVPSATLVGARLGFSTDNWSVSVYGKNLTDEDSVAVATRWFTNPYVGFSTIGAINSTPLQTGAGLAANGLPAFPPANGIATAPPAGTALNSVAAYALPRGFFAMLRRERQVGLELTYRF